MGRGWHNESHRHSLASRGIKTKTYVKPFQSRSVSKYPKMIYPDDILTPENLNTILSYVEATDNKVEWICDIDLKRNEKIKIEDGQLDGTTDESFLNWNSDDPSLNVGFCHSHPEGVFNWFSSTDFLLAIKIHNLRTRENKERFPWTFMGLVSKNDDGIYTLQLVAVKPGPGRKKQFEGMEKDYIDDLEGTHDRVLRIEQDMNRNEELVRFPEIELISQ